MVMALMLNSSTVGPVRTSSAVMVLLSGSLGGGSLVSSSSSLVVVVVVALSGSLGSGSLASSSSSLAAMVILVGGVLVSSSSSSISTGRDDISDFLSICTITSFTPRSGMIYGSSSSFNPKYSSIDLVLKRYCFRKAFAKSSQPVRSLS
jgi:hypothetical protein